MVSLPDSYQTLSLPAVRLSHHPPSSESVTPVVLVILNRPKHKNAFNTDMIESLEKVFGTLDSDPRVKCVVLTGSDPQNRIFCAGMDLAGSPAAGKANDGPPDAPGPVTRDTRRFCFFFFFLFFLSSQVSPSRPSGTLREARTGGFGSHNSHPGYSICTEAHLIQTATAAAA